MFELLLALSLMVDTHVQKLITQLGDDSFVIRKKAHEDLEKVGLPAYKRLLESSDHKDLEIAYRSRRLVKNIEGPIYHAERALAEKTAVVVTVNHLVVSGTIIKSTDDKTYILTVIPTHNRRSQGVFTQYNNKIKITHGKKEYDARYVVDEENEDLAILSIDKGKLPSANLTNKTPKGKICHFGASSNEITLHEGLADGETLTIDTHYGNLGAGVFVMECGSLKMHSIIVNTFGGGQLAINADRINDFLKDVEW